VAAAGPGGEEAAAAAVPDKLLATITAFGSAEQCNARLDDFRAAGVDVPVVSPIPAGGDAFASWSQTVGAFRG